MVRLCCAMLSLAAARALASEPLPSPDGSGAGAVPDAQAEILRIAVAANFRAPLQHLANRFEQAHGITLAPSFGSSGLLAAQIRQGAPFDAYFSADTIRPQALIDDGLATGPLTVYARGRVALRTSGHDISRGNHRIGLPNPDLAPYGAAAVQCLERLGVWQQLQGRLVFGNNVNQLDHFLESGALHAGFVALSQLLARDIAPERYWVCPADFHAPIDQGAVVLDRTRNVDAARALMHFMTEPDTRARLAQLGYAYRD